MSEKEYEYLKDTILVTYPDGPETYGATQAAPSSGMDTSDATATAGDIRADKTAYVASGKVTGTIEDYDGSSEPASGKSLFAQLADKSITEVSASDLAGASEIGDYAFYKCSNLTDITIPNNVTSIASYAFCHCHSLASISLPDSVTSIEERVFESCGSLTSIMIPDSVTRIGNSTFQNCSNLMSITIPNSVKIFGTYTFYYCGTATESGTTYTFLPTTPPTIQSSTFSNAKINKIIVPVGTADTYKAATNWSALADYIEEATA